MYLITHYFHLLFYFTILKNFLDIRDKREITSSNQGGLASFSPNNYIIAYTPLETPRTLANACTTSIFDTSAAL